MQATRQNMFMRDDTFFGVCQALGEDFRFSPTLLRLAFALGFFWNPLVVTGAYLALGVLVAITRFVAPDPRPVEKLRMVPVQPEQDREEAQAPAAEEQPVEEFAVAA